MTQVLTFAVNNACLFQDLGFISVGVRFEPREGLLHVMVDQAKALPQHQLTGPPGESNHLFICPSVHSSDYPFQGVQRWQTAHSVDHTFCILTICNFSYFPFF